MFETKIADLLNDHEGMKGIFIKINPRFKKCNNPVLRRPWAKITGVKQAAVIGGMDPTYFQPEPLIKAFEKTGYEVYCHQQGRDHFMTYIKK